MRQFRSTERFQQQLKHLFPADAWEMQQPNVLHSEGMTVLFQDYQPRDDGTVRIFPCTVVLLRDDPTADTRLTAPLILQAPEGALLRLNRPLDLRTTQVGQPVEGRLLGEIRIHSPGTGDGRGQLNIVTSNVQIKPQQLWTPHEVVVEYDNSSARGQDLMIKLLPERKDGRTAPTGGSGGDPVAGTGATGSPAPGARIDPGGRQAAAVRRPVRGTHRRRHLPRAGADRSGGEPCDVRRSSLAAASRTGRRGRHAPLRSAVTVSGAGQCSSAGRKCRTRRTERAAQHRAALDGAPGHGGRRTGRTAHRLEEGLGPRTQTAVRSAATPISTLGGGRQRRRSGTAASGDPRVTGPRTWTAS